MVATVVGLALAISSCGGGGAPEPKAAPEKETPATGATPSSEEPVRGGDLTIAVESEVGSLLPGQSELPPALRNLPFAIFDPLVVTAADGSFQPYLAERITYNEELTEWTVKLRPGVTFHDGTLLDAVALKTIFDEYLTADGATTAGQLASVTDLRIDDALTVTYVLAEANGAFPDVLRGPAGWPFSVAAARTAGDDAGLAPAGTGPFRVAERVLEDTAVVVRNDSYWREGLPYLDSITFRPIADEELRSASLVAGTVDGVQSLRGTTIKEIMEAAEDGGITTHTYAGDDAGVGILNTLRPPFDDPRMRRAYAHFYDQEAIAEIMGDDGLVEPSTQFFSADSPWYSEEVAAARPKFDPAKARALVEEYTNDPERSDGKPVGTRPSVTYSCLGESALLSVSLLVQQQADDVGIDLEIDSVDAPVLISRLTGTADTDPPFAGDFDVACYRMQHSGDPANTFANTFGPVETTAGNMSNFSTPALVSLIDQLRITGPPADRYRLVEQIGLIVNEAVPMTFATGTPAMIAVQDKVRNITGWTTPEGSPGDGIPFADVRWGEVWIGH